MSVKTDDLASSDETKIWKSLKLEEEQDRKFQEQEAVMQIIDFIVSSTYSRFLLLLFLFVQLFSSSKVQLKFNSWTLATTGQILLSAIYS